PLRPPGRSELARGQPPPPGNSSPSSRAQYLASRSSSLTPRLILEPCPAASPAWLPSRLLVGKGNANAVPSPKHRGELLDDPGEVVEGVRSCARMRLSIAWLNEHPALRDRLDGRAVGGARPVAAPAQAPGAAPRRPPGGAQRHPVPHPHRLPVAAAAPRLPALEHRVHLVPPLAPGRYLAAAQRRPAAPGPGPRRSRPLPAGQRRG